MEIKRILAATVVAVFMGGVAFAQTSVLRDAEQRKREVEQRKEQEKLRQAATNFVVVGPGVVRDKTTGLEWMRCSMGQDWSEKTKTCEGTVDKYTFEQAQEVARRLNAAGGYKGKADWRVPTEDELVTLRLCSNGADGDSCAEGSLTPTIAQTVFPRTPENWYWTSSPSVGDSSYAWVVHFYNGFVGSGGSDGSYYVRLVRASQ